MIYKNENSSSTIKVSLYESGYILNHELYNRLNPYTFAFGFRSNKRGSYMKPLIKISIDLETLE